VSIAILIADDQTFVRTGFRMILDAEHDMRVVAEANGAEAVEATRRLRPDVVLMDIRMPRMDGLEATRTLFAGGCTETPRVLTLTTFDLDEYVFDALRAGASGFLLKDVPPEQLIAGIRAVAQGEALLVSSVTPRLIESFVNDHRIVDPPPAFGELAEREHEILTLIARGLSNAEIAKECSCPRRRSRPRSRGSSPSSTSTTGCRPSSSHTRP